jgi:putative PIN family toxin of toxin-antitoxin system
LRVILDTNVLISALIVPRGAPSYLYRCWRKNRFTLISSEEQLEEFRRVTRYPRLERFLDPATAGTMVNAVRALAVLTGPLPRVDASPDPADNFLLAMAVTGKADLLVTGDGKHLMSPRRHADTRIVTPREAARALGCVER